MSVIVTRVAIEYAFNGKAFRLDITNPSMIDSLVFNRVDVTRLQQKQQTETKKKIDPLLFNPGEPSQFAIGDSGVFAIISKETGTAPNLTPNLLRSLWWHTESCDWFHPADEAPIVA